MFAPRRGQYKELLKFSAVFPKAGNGPSGTKQVTGPLVTKAGDGLVPIRICGTRPAHPESSLPYTQHTQKDKGTYIEREVPCSVEEITTEKEKAKKEKAEKEKEAKMKAKEKFKPIPPRAPKTKDTGGSKRSREDQPTAEPAKRSRRSVAS